jgi:hypothetical protein
MPIEETIVLRIEELITESVPLRSTDEHGQANDAVQMQLCSGWIVSALNIVQIICPNEKNSYRKKAEEIASRESAWVIPFDVGEFAALLKNLSQDIDKGLLSSIADKARAETFDDFLEHGRDYLDQKKKQEAGVICGVVFEDTLRRISRKHGLVERDVKLDALISELTKIEVLSGVKAKRARVAAHVRTKATHAQWDDFELSDVSATIDITQELINTQLD